MVFNYCHTRIRRVARTVGPAPQRPADHRDCDWRAKRSRRSGRCPWMLIKISFLPLFAVMLQWMTQRRSAQGKFIRDRGRALCCAARNRRSRVEGRCLLNCQNKTLVDWIVSRSAGFLTTGSPQQQSRGPAGGEAPQQQRLVINQRSSGSGPSNQSAHKGACSPA